VLEVGNSQVGSSGERSLRCRKTILGFFSNPSGGTSLAPVLNVSNFLKVLSLSISKDMLNVKNDHSKLSVNALNVQNVPSCKPFKYTRFFVTLMQEYNAVARKFNS